MKTPRWGLDMRLDFRIAPEERGLLLDILTI